MLGSFIKKIAPKKHDGRNRKLRSSKKSSGHHENARDFDSSDTSSPRPAFVTINGSNIDRAVEQARDAMEASLKEAQTALKHARNEIGVAESEYERLSHEVTQARDIYEQADSTMDSFVRSSLKQYWRLAQKRKKAAFRTKKAAILALEEARDAFEYRLKKALDNVDRARRGEVPADLPQPEMAESNVSADETPETMEEEPVPNYDYLKPHKMFGMFNAKAYLEKMEVEASDVESGDEGYW